MLVTGVRSSWATSATRLRRSSSVRDSSSTIELKVRASSPTSSRDLTSARDEKSCCATCRDTLARDSMGERMRRDTKKVRSIATPTASRPLRTSSVLRGGPVGKEGGHAYGHQDDHHHAQEKLPADAINQGDHLRKSRGTACCAPTEGLTTKLVAHSIDCPDVFGVIGVLLNLASQVQDMHINS